MQMTDLELQVCVIGCNSSRNKINNDIDEDDKHSPEFLAFIDGKMEEMIHLQN